MTLCVSLHALYKLQIYHFRPKKTSPDTDFPLASSTSRSKKKAASSFPLIGITSTFRSNQSTFHTIIPNVNYGITDRHFAQLVEQRRLADEGKYPVTTESSPMESNSKKPTESASNKFFAIGYCGS